MSIGGVASARICNQLATPSSSKICESQRLNYFGFEDKVKIMKYNNVAFELTYCETKLGKRRFSVPPFIIQNVGEV